VVTQTAPKVKEPPKLPRKKSQATTPVTPPTTPTPSTNSTPPPVNNGSSADGAAAEGVVRDYWNTLASGDLSGAYAFLDPSAADSREHWISLRQNDGLSNVTFYSLTPTQVSSTDATVSADFETQQSSCQDQHWTGYYHLVKIGGEWLIHNHELNKPPC
jgi:hypothetical protein